MIRQFLGLFLCAAAHWPRRRFRTVASGDGRRGCQKHAKPGTGAQRKAFLEEGARKEGEVIWYTSMSLTDFPKIVGAFERSYPYVKIKTNRLSQSSIMPKIETEARAGHYAVDLVALGAGGDVGTQAAQFLRALSFA